MQRSRETWKKPKIKNRGCLTNAIRVSQSSMRNLAAATLRARTRRATALQTNPRTTVKEAMISWLRELLSEGTRFPQVCRRRATPAVIV